MTREEIMELDLDALESRANAIALATALFDNMRQNEQLCDIIFAAAALYEEHEQQMSDRLELN